ncbi:MAG TPA: vWA domain-containing protein [Pyrinomonadaceae bacterium]|jgi:hypothetical protein
MLRRIVLNLLSGLLLTLILCNSVFAQSEKKIAYGILIDNTASLRSQLPEVLEISQGIVGRIHQQGPISLFNFTPEGNKRNQIAVVNSVAVQTQDKNLLDNYINQIFIVPGRTALMDAINSIAEQLNTKASLDKDTFAEKVIYLVTDGEDRTSKIKEKQLTKALKESGIKVYAVGLIKELENEGGYVQKSPKDKATDFLEKITQETGGRVVFLKSKKDTVDGLLNKLFAK